MNQKQKEWSLKIRKWIETAVKKIILAFIVAFILVPMLGGLTMFYLEMYAEAKEFITNPAQAYDLNADSVIIYREKGKLELTDKLLEIYIDSIDVNIAANKNSIGYRQNNPCNLVYAGQPGATKNGRFAEFKTPEIGFRACVKQVAWDQGKNLSLEQFISKFAPSFENDTEGYIKDIAKAMECDRKTNISKLDTIELAKQMAKHEASVKVVENL